MNPVIERMQDQLAALQPVELQITDDSHKHAGHAGAKDGGGHYHLRIVSPRFTGVPVPARHRMVYSAIGAMMGREIHALSITPASPEETNPPALPTD